MDSDEPVVGNSEVKKLRGSSSRSGAHARPQEMESICSATPSPSGLKNTDIAADLVVEDGADVDRRRCPQCVTLQSR